MWCTCKRSKAASKYIWKILFTVTKQHLNVLILKGKSWTTVPDIRSAVHPPFHQAILVIQFFAAQYFEAWLMPLFAFC